MSREQNICRDAGSQQDSQNTNAGKEMQVSQNAAGVSMKTAGLRGGGFLNPGDDVERAQLSGIEP